MNLSDARFDSLYCGRWQLGFSRYEGADFSRLCVLFSGQGTAFPGMFRAEYEQLAPLRRRFDEADDLARSVGLPPPSCYITDSAAVPASELVIIRNLATYTLQVGLFDHLIGTGLVPQLLTGSSQGEYAALACSGGLDFASLFQVHIARHRICGAPNALGFLLAVAASPDQITEVLGLEGVYLSIVNSPIRSVVALRPQRLVDVHTILKRRGIACKVLEVPHPYHSPMMVEAADRFRAWLGGQQLSFETPRYPVFSSVTKSCIDGPMRGVQLANLLSRQLVEPVDFPLQIEAAYAQRCFAFLEAGPGAALGTFVKKILGKQEHKVLELASYLPVAPETKKTKTKLNTAQSRIFGVLRKAVATLTGYEIESISIEDRFQEDLAIDSLKKVEIMVSVVEEIDPGRPEISDILATQNLADAVDRMAQPHEAERASYSTNSSRIARHKIVWQPAPLNGFAAEQAGDIQIVSLRKLLDRGFTLSPALLENTLVLWAEAGDFSFEIASDQSATHDLERVLKLFDAFRSVFAYQPDKCLDLFLVSCGDSHPFASGLAGFFKSLAQENNTFRFKYMQFSDRPSEDGLRRLVCVEQSDPYNVDVRYEDGRRNIASLVQVEEVTPVQYLREDSVVIVFGGAKGITKVLLEHGVISGQAHLYLVGRSPQSEVAASLATLTHITPNLHYRCLDAQGPGAVSSLMNRVHERHGRIDLVINAVGVEKSELLVHKSVEDRRSELCGKLVPSINILRAARAAGTGLVVNFGSIASRWGNAGQSIYACANDIAGALTAAHNRSLGRVAAIVIEWPAWDGVGMTANPAVQHQLRQRRLSLLEPKRAAQLFVADLRQAEQEIVTYVDPADARLFNALAVDRRADRRLIGERSPEGWYRRILDRRADPWLKDHTIDAVSYLPAATAITMACALAPFSPRGIRQIDNFEMTQAVAVRDEPVALRLELEKRGEGLGLCGRTTSVHFRCQFGDAVALPSVNTLVPAYGCEIDVTTLYSEKLFFHGPTFQVLHRAWVSDDGAIGASIDTARLRPVYGVDRWDRLTLWLDGAFQALALAAFQQKPVLAIPIAVQRIYLGDRIAQPAFVTLRPTAVAMGSNDVTGNVVLAAEGQRPIIYLEGVRLRILSMPGRKMVRP